MSDQRIEDLRELSEQELAAIEEKYDEGAATRAVTPAFGKFLRYVALSFAVYHYLTAGFALPPDYWHMGWHLSGLFILTYSFYPIFKTKTAFDLRTGRLRFAGVPYLDIALMILGVMAALYLGLAWRGIEWMGVEEMTFRMGNPIQSRGYCYRACQQTGTRADTLWPSFQMRRNDS